MSETNVTIGVDVTGLGDESQMRHRFSTNTDPTAVQRGYGTIAAANTVEALVLGQCAASLMHTLYIRAVDGTLHINPVGTVSTRHIAVLSGESAVFTPEHSLVLSIGIWASAAGVNYEYQITGLSS
ncbi:MAG: hypothetical protein ACYSTZ_00080 [Planctomycetota bacterium]|jgi:hypothetical protein